MKRQLALFSMMALLLNPVFAQTKKYPASVGIMGGLTEYSGDLGQGMYTFTDAKAFAGLSFGYYVNTHLDFEFNTSLGRLGYTEPHNLKFDTRLWQSNIHFRFKVLDAEKYKVVPYLLVGAGVAFYSDFSLKTTDGGVDVPPRNGSGADVFLPFGAGAQYQINDRWNIYIQETFAYTDHDDRDNEERNTNDAFVLHTVGLSYNFAFGKDEDKDGVKDKRDKCPQTPLGIAVDNIGCPLDNDSDGIANYLDSCVEVKGVASAHGCPDADADSITDKEDECPTAYGPLALKGCPDKDKDGILDKDDKCPDAAGTSLTQGCPDTDEDGVADADDDCPSEKGSAATRGCPDKDTDGVADKDDKCPDVAGTVANNGCPEAPSVVLQGIQFDTGKDIIKKSYYAILNKAVDVMKENASYKLSIEGHADNTGSEERNAALSENRAKAVMQYLINKKIDPSRLRAKGFSSSMPVESNDTAAGRAKNRRVEIKPEY